MNIPSEDREVLFPTVRRHIVDEVCEQIVVALHQRDFNVPSVKVHFNERGWAERAFERTATGGLLCRGGWRPSSFLGTTSVSSIQGPDFFIGFGKRVFTPGYKDNLGVVQVHIPGKELRLSTDDSQIYQHLCNPQRPIGACVHGYRPHSIAWYRPSAAGLPLQPPAEPSPPVYLISVDDNWLQHGYPQHFLTRNVLSDFAGWLMSNVLALIESVPRSRGEHDIQLQPAPPPVCRGTTALAGDSLTQPAPQAPPRSFANHELNQG